MSPQDVPNGRDGHTAIWTGSQMVIWGGRSGVRYNTGGRYDPATDTWTPTSTTGAPQARFAHTAVWTGRRMIVWGGGTNGGMDTGGRYDPAADVWAPTAMTGAPERRWLHASAWTGSLMLVWGGAGNGASYLATGGRYDPGADAWIPITLVNAPVGRNSHTLVWTGSFAVVWGGYGGRYLGTGGRYALGHADDDDDDDDGFTECAGDCNDALSTAFPGAEEACDGADNDCDGLIDELPSPGALEGLRADTVSLLSWQPAENALAYDVLRGSLGALRASGGDFSTSILACVEDDSPELVATDAVPPDAAGGFYYLVRAVGCGDDGTYDTAAPSQEGSRDAEIALSVGACP